MSNALQVDVLKVEHEEKTKIDICGDRVSIKAAISNSRVRPLKDMACHSFQWKETYNEQIRNQKATDEEYEKKLAADIELDKHVQVL